MIVCAVSGPSIACNQKLPGIGDRFMIVCAVSGPPIACNQKLPGDRFMIVCAVSGPSIVNRICAKKKLISNLFLAHEPLYDSAP